MKKEELVRRITNSIRKLEHATCSAGGEVLDLEDFVPAALKKLGVEKFLLDRELLSLRTLSDDISTVAADLHLKLAQLAESEDVKIPIDRVVNTGGGGKGP